MTGQVEVSREARQRRADVGGFVLDRHLGLPDRGRHDRRRRPDEHVAEGRLRRVLEEWCPTFPGYHIYFPRRRQSLPALSLVIEALRYRPGS